MGRFLSAGVLATVAGAAPWQTFVLDWKDASTSPTDIFTLGYGSTVSNAKTTYLSVCKDTVSGATFASGKYSLAKPVDFSDGIVCHSNPMYVQPAGDGKVVAFTYSVVRSAVSSGLFAAADVEEAWTLAKAAVTKENLGKAAVTAVGSTAVWKEIKTTAGVPYLSGSTVPQYLTASLYLVQGGGGQNMARAEANGGTAGQSSVDLAARRIGNIFATRLALNAAYTANTLGNWSSCADFYVAAGGYMACSIVIRGDKLVTKDDYTLKTPAEMYTAVLAQLVTDEEGLYGAFRVNHQTAGTANEWAGAFHDWSGITTHGAGASSRLLAAGLRHTETAATAFTSLAEGSTAPTKDAVTAAGYPFATAGGHALAAADADFALTVTITLGAAAADVACTAGMVQEGLQHAYKGYTDWKNFGTAVADVKAKIATAIAVDTTSVVATLGVKVAGGFKHRVAIQTLLEDMTPSEILMGLTRGLARGVNSLVVDNAKALKCGLLLTKVKAVSRSKALDMYTAPTLASVAYAGDKTIKVSGVLKLPVADADKAKAFPDIDDMAKNGVAALMRTILPATASINAQFDSAAVTLSKATTSSKPATTTAKPAARRGLAAKNLISWNFTVELKKGAKLKVAGANTAAKDKAVTDAGTAIVTAVEAAATSGQKKAIAEAMVLTAVSKYRALPDDAKKTERKTAFTGAFGSAGIDTTDKSFDIQKKAAVVASTSSAFVPLVSGVVLLLVGAVAVA